ncbi:MAG: hypothetical protein Q7S57_06180 [bacterium]|nr:hypothetical protein [bacterium]
MRYLLAIVVLVIIFFPFASHGATPSDEFWNPFRNDTTNFTQEITDIIHNLLAVIGTFAGQVVSKVRIPAPQTQSAYKNTQAANYGVKSGGYNLNNISLKSLVGAIPQPAPKITDTEEEGKPCGGGSGDPFWAKDCSCHCSTGAKKDTEYEATGYCPDDTNRRCEDCRDITRHDNSYTKVTECLQDF